MNLEIAAFHECGHAVAAMASRFHSAPLALTATTSGHGDAYFGPSARKLRDAGKPADQSCVSDPEVAREAALICFAGLAAEKRRCQEMGPPATADAAASWADDKMARNFLADAGVSLEEEQELRASAEAVIAKHWTAITALSRALLDAPGTTLDAVDANAIAQPLLAS